MAAAVLMLMVVPSVVWGAGGPPAPGGPARYSHLSALTEGPQAARTWGHVLPSGNASNYSWCDPLPPGLEIVNLGVNFSVATMPANGSGPGPLNFSWNTSVNSGGLPPYQTEIWIWQPLWQYFNLIGPPNSSGNGNLGAFSFNSTNFTGNVTLSAPGLYDVYVEVGDSSCTQVSGDWGSVQVWNSLGPNPATVTASVSSITVPGNVSYNESAPGLPPGWATMWAPAYLYANNTSSVNHTYYVPGTYSASACTVEPNGALYSCTSSPNVTATGPAIIAVSAAVANASGGQSNLTFSARETRASALPNGTLLWVTASNGTNDSMNFSSTGWVNLTELVPCGPPATYVPPSGQCTWVAWVDVIGPPGSPDGGALATIPIFANVTAPGGPANWYPSVTYSDGPTNSSAAPLNLSLNLSAANGLAPYSYSWVALGRQTVNITGTFYSPLRVNGTGWNGSQLSFTIPLNFSGVYWIEIVVQDSDSNVLAYALPLVTVAYVPAPPLLIQAFVSYGTSTLPTGTPASFLATATSGIGPFTVQWAFGDGTYGSSLLGQRISHAYTRSGSYAPVVTITDGLGHSVTEQLPVVTVVAPNGTTGPGPTSAAPAASPTWLARVLGALPQWAWFLVALALAGVGYLLTEREIDREGRELVADLERSDDGSAPDTPTAR